MACADLGAAIADLKSQGYRLDIIFPADEPYSATLSRDGDTIRLTSRPGAPRPASALAPFQPEFRITRGGASGEGRAGMGYRDLIPGRLGGRYIASHITMGGGPVADWVHYHHVTLQLIAVRRGWVRVVYEDQGEPFVMRPGDLVLQPPGIRHRVLESSPGLEVLEVGCPALHETLADHEMTLPTARGHPHRLFNGQRFLHHVAAGGGPICLDAATGGVAAARLIRGAADVPAHDGELVFGFVMEGKAVLEFEGAHQLGPTDAFVIPPEMPWRLDDASDDFQLFHLTTARLGLADG
jgi:quercetin dioxygenase-like cupin family protein